MADAATAAGPTVGAVIEEAPARPFAGARALVGPVSRSVPLVAAAAAASGAGVVLEALLLGGVVQGAAWLVTPESRAGAVAVLAGLVAAMLAFDLVGHGAGLRLGRHLEARLRQALLAKLPRLSDRYFASRLRSDMTERSHSLVVARGLPGLLHGLGRAATELVVTAAAMAALYPGTGGWVLAASATSLVLPLGVRTLLAERDMAARALAAAAGRVYLDSLLGLVAIRAHGAEGLLRGEHDRVLAALTRARRQRLAAAVAVESSSSLATLAMAVVLVGSHLRAHGAEGGLLLLVYWALKLRDLGGEIAHVVPDLAAQRSVLTRLFEPLSAPEEEPPLPDGAPASADPPEGPEIEYVGVSAMAGGNTLLHDVTLRIPGGSCTAIVGRSGAGKSTLVGLLLGWHPPSSGEVLVDGMPLDATRLAALRRSTAWVDPSVRIWNRSLAENLAYGVPGGGRPLGEVLATAGLDDMLADLPQGLETALGEGGALLAGGEGQRVRVGRVLARGAVRLAILDEGFRGLDREHRRALLLRVRAAWPGATLLHVTHDVADTAGFDQVVVQEDGAVLEAGAPADLLQTDGSAYASLAARDAALRDHVWADASWRRWRMDAGRVTEMPSGPACA